MAETTSNKSKKRKMKTINRSLLNTGMDFSNFDSIIFPQILAASFNIQNPKSRSLIVHFLHSLLNLKSLRTLPHSFLSILPLLIKSRFDIVTSLSLEVIGAAALCSIDTNMIVASDESVAKGLVWALGRKSRRLSWTACNTLMDVATSAVGRDKLREAYAVEKLLSLFSQVATQAYNDCSIKISKDDNYPALILDALILLVNTSTEHFFDRIPREVFEQNLPLFRELYKTLQSSQLAGSCAWYHNSSRSTKSDLAFFIFRIFVNQSAFQSWGLNDIIQSIFGTESKFIHFSLTQWEESPILLKDTRVIDNKDSIFNSLINPYGSKTTGAMINSIFHQLVSCPPIVSDELNIFSFLNEARNILGSPIVHGQDIRVLKTLKHDKEIHFAGDNMIQAFNSGYTLALRGMEFRSVNIAAISNALSILFGQPSVGANLYITPSKSQGLAKHYDDHCVFVWQLFGKKRWKMSSVSAAVLPRLYEPTSAVSEDLCGDMQYLLNEGDILYIPRGFLHEACTISDENEVDGNAATNFSIHLTFGIEVEAPFEWEGFTHIALHRWNEKHKRITINNTDSKSRIRNNMFIIILHIAIRQLANANPTLKKACMVAAHPFSPETHKSGHKQMFRYITEEIKVNANFLEALKCIKRYAEDETDDSLQWLRWLRHLSQEDEEIDFDNLSGVLGGLVMMFNDCIEEAVVEFECMKAIFCRDASFEDAYKCFLELLEKYRGVRRQYRNGMLALHSR